MIILLSPAKRQDFSICYPEIGSSQPETKADIKLLIKELKQYNKPQIGKLMCLSPQLVQLNYDRYQAFTPNRFDFGNAKQAIFAFQGDVYQTLNPSGLPKAAIDFLQKHLLILSGLYGYLRPLDLIQPYRLEMKTKLKNPRGSDLYAFWQEIITHAINEHLSRVKNKLIINLASNEYFKVIDAKNLQGKLITIDFKEKYHGKLMTVGINAKRARGLMTRFIALKKISTIDGLKTFAEAGYRFTTEHSKENKLTFFRDKQPS